MKRLRFTEEQIIGVLREQEAGAKGADLCRKYGMSEATLYNWKAKYGGLDVSEAKRLKALEDENAKLKRLLADAMLDAAALKSFWKKMVGPAAKREARRSSSDVVRDERAAGHDPRRRGPNDDPLSIAATGRCGAMGAAARSRVSAPSFRQPAAPRALAT